jgi:hypothetical protein
MATRDELMGAIAGRYAQGDRVEELRATLNPVGLLQEIRATQQRFVEIADMPPPATPTAPTLEQFPPRAAHGLA